MSLSSRHDTPSSGILSFAAEDSEEERERVEGEKNEKNVANRKRRREVGRLELLENNKKRD